MTESLKISIFNGSSTLTIGDNSCMFKLIAHSGFAAADYDVQLATGGSSDGGYITSARLSSRTLGIKFDFGGKLGENTRQRLIHFFSPYKSLTVTATRGNISREITGVAADFDISETNRFAHSVVSLSIICPDPYFKAVSSARINAAEVTPLFVLPFGIPSEGIPIGVQSSTGNVLISNDGDTYADMTAELTANSTATAPYLLNRTTGKRLAVKNTLGSGDILTISTVRRAKGAFINGSSCTIDPASQFSDFLTVGSNVLTYSAAEGSGMLALIITVTELYLGI